MKKILCGALGLISVGLLGGCGNNNAIDDTSTQNGSDDEQKSEVGIVKNDNLTVDQNKCVGCGKCARIASDNFEMNVQTRKAQVKSKEITNQVLIDRAISVCHPQAISQ